MPRLTTLLGILLCSFAGYGQQNDDAHQNKGDATRQEGPAQKPAPLTTADTPGAQDAAASANESGSDAMAAPGVESATASPSGSPAVPIGKKGTGRDGTNTVQEASMNMAGARTENLQLDKRAVDANSEMRDRQNRSQAKQKSNNKSAEINEKTRRENNEMSDQNLSAKERSNGQADAAKNGSGGKSNKKRKKKG